MPPIIKVALCLMVNEVEYIDLNNWSDVEDFTEAAKTKMVTGKIKSFSVTIKEMSEDEFKELDTLKIIIHK